MKRATRNSTKRNHIREASKQLLSYQLGYMHFNIRCYYLPVYRLADLLEQKGQFKSNSLTSLTSSPCITKRTKALTICAQTVLARWVTCF